MYVVFFVLFLLYILTKCPYFGLLAGLLILGYFIYDISQSVKKKGIRSEIKEMVTAIILALAIWFTLCLVLKTSSPINAVVSCSMLPNLQRGDMVILKGDVIKVPTISMKENELSKIDSKAVIRYGNITFMVNGSLYYYCMCHPQSSICYVFRKQPGLFEEFHGPLLFKYTTCTKRSIDTGSTFTTICLDYIQYNGTKYRMNASNDIIVYQPKPTDLFARVGDIIHRAYIGIKTENGMYYITKGDNNPVTDLQMSDCYGTGNSLVRESQVKGRVLFRLPIVGYIKLILSGMVSEPAGCDSVYE